MHKQGKAKSQVKTRLIRKFLRCWIEWSPKCTKVQPQTCLQCNIATRTVGQSPSSSNKHSRQDTRQKRFGNFLKCSQKQTEWLTRHVNKTYNSLDVSFFSLPGIVVELMEGFSDYLFEITAWSPLPNFSLVGNVMVFTWYSEISVHQLRTLSFHAHYLFLQVASDHLDAAIVRLAFLGLPLGHFCCPSWLHERQISNCTNPLALAGFTPIETTVKHLPRY